MAFSEISFDDLPLKAKRIIFRGLTQTERQNNRRICKSWDRTFLEEFPVELTITNDDFGRLFLCPVARKVTISNLTVEYTGRVAFAGAIRHLEITGKVLSSNLIRILHDCQHLESLVFSSLKQVLEIESSEVFGLPKVTTLEIRVRPDQETFTSDEMIIISTLRQIQFGSLESIVISVHNMVWDEDDDDDLDQDLNDSNDDFELIAVDTETSEQSTVAPRVPIYPSLASQGHPDIIDTHGSRSQQLQQQQAGGPPTDTVIVVEVSIADVSTVNDRPLVSEQSTGIDSSTSGSLNSFPSMNDFEFAGRLFNTRLRMELRNSDVDLESFLNDPSRSQLRSNRNRLQNANQSSLRTSVFFEFMHNNSQKLKKFIVKTRPDFMCFGNISSFSKEVSKIQLEEIEYSFGRSQLCLEYMLLQVQSKLHRIRVHILDDLWDHLMTALEKSRETVADVDLKILSLSEDPIDLITLSHCKSLQVLKLLHFFDKNSLKFLPNSLTKLILNGPVHVEDLLSFAVRLINLVEFTLILNNTGGKVDINLFKRFVTMPKMAKLIFIQCLIDVDGISNYCEDIPGIVFNVEGPRILMNIPSIQYVMVSINSNFDRKITLDS